MKVEVEKDYLDKLESDSKILNILYEFGVDNWEWYSDAMTKLESENESK